MRKQIVAVLLALALVPYSLMATAQEHTHEHGTVSELNLTLNNGHKWIADKHTMDSVHAMIAMADKQTASASLQDLQSLGTQLHDELQNLIRGCKMTGSDHDQLHAWITALVPAIQALSKAPDTEAGRLARAKVSRLLQAFGQHFQATVQAE